MTTQFCNGGTLHTLLFRTLAHASMPLAEIFIWKIFTQLLYTFKYLHHHRHSVVHLDLLHKNVFFDWEEQSLAEEGASKHHLPDVYLGDFGLADEASHPDFAPSDLQMLHTLLIKACLGEIRNGCSLPGWQDRFPRQYSAELRKCLTILPEPLDFHGRSKLVKDVAPTKVLRERIMQIAERKMEELEGRPSKYDYRFTKPSRPGHTQQGDVRF
jgi:serine/threonine protein kinase